MVEGDYEKSIQSQSVSAAHLSRVFTNFCLTFAWDSPSPAATGSYISVLPTSLASTLAPSHGDAIRIYQAGGPVAQTFSVSPTTGGYDQLLQEIVYLDGGSEELWDDKTDRTRVALRYGSHAVDIDPIFARAYIPHVCV